MILERFAQIEQITELNEMNWFPTFELIRSIFHMVFRIKADRRLIERKNIANNVINITSCQQNEQIPLTDGCKQLKIDSDQYV